MDARFAGRPATDLLVAVRPARPARQPRGAVGPAPQAPPAAPRCCSAPCSPAASPPPGSACTGAPAASAEATSVLAAQEALLAGEEGLELKPQASVTVAEAQARLQEVAASRAARAEAEAAARRGGAAQVRAADRRRPPDQRLRRRWGTFHYGIDLAAPMRTPEYAAGDGVVLRAGAASGFGLAVYILHENGDVTVYGHMDEILVEPGQYVDAGETIALLGNRGQSTGPHLHFEVHRGGEDGERIDPVTWLSDRGVNV